MTTRITPIDFINSAKHMKGDIFEWDYAHASDNNTNHIKKGTKASYDTTWVPILFKKVDSEGNVTKVQVKAFDFEHVIVSYGPTLPSTTDNKDNNGVANKVKCMLLVFKEMKLNEIKMGDYIPKVKSNRDDQIIEDERMEQFVMTLYHNTKEFTDALNVIATGFQILAQTICKQVVEGTIKFPFNMAKESSWLVKDASKKVLFYNPPIRSIRQIERKNNDDPNNPIPLEFPIFRLKMPVHDDKMLITWRKSNGPIETKEYIFDARKTLIDTRTSNSTLVPAKVRNPITNKVVPLNVANVGDFITSKSIVAGRLELPKLVISKQGISLENKFLQLIIKRHKLEPSNNIVVNTNALIFMKGDSDGEDDLDPVLPELQLDSAPTLSKQTTDNGAEDVNETDVNDKSVATDSSEDDDNEEEVMTVVKKSAPKKTIAKKVVAKKTTKKPAKEVDDESDDSEVDL